MIRPLHDRVVLKRLPQEQTTRGGIYIPDAYVDKAQMCEVIAVGDGRPHPYGACCVVAGAECAVHAPGTANGYLPMRVKAGDCVLIGKYDGNDVKVDGEELVITREDFLLAVIERSAPNPDAAAERPRRRAAPERKPPTQERAVKKGTKEARQNGAIGSFPAKSKRAGAERPQ